MDNTGLPTPGAPAPLPIPPELPPTAPAPAPVAPPTIAALPPAASATGGRKNRGWMIAAILLSIVLVGMVGLNLLSFLGDMQGGARPGAGPNLVEVTVQDHQSHDKIAVLSVEGVIYSSAGEMDMTRMLRAQLKRAREDKRVKAVVLKIDSPGGEVLASENIYAEIVKFQEETGKPVVASMGSVAASGGYYVAAPCRWIVAHELTITGSIGVIMHGYNYRGLMNKVGVRPEIYKSGKFKDMMSGDKDTESMSAEERAIYEEERKMVQSLIMEAYGTFKDRIAKGRGKAAELNKAANLGKGWTNYADGRILSGRQALELGFVDETGSFEVAVKRAERISGISQANLVTYSVPFEFGNLLRLLGKSETPAIKVDMGVDLPPVRSGRLYFLAPIL